MAGVDIGILVIIFLPAIVGLLCGLLNIVFSIAAWIMALVTAAKLSSHLSPLLDNMLEPILTEVIAFASVFIISLVLFTGLGYFVVKLLGRTGLTVVNRILGFLFGIGLGGAIITILVFLAGFTAISEREWWHEAILIEPFQHVCVWGQRFLSEDIAVYHRYWSNPAVE